MWRFAPCLTALGLDDGRARITCEPKVNREDTQVENLCYGRQGASGDGRGQRRASSTRESFA